ncbi:TPA: hypothetical protein ACP41M_001072 [Klebsiella aerogenes]
MSASVPNYIDMASSAAQSGVNTARGMLGALQQGYDFGTKMQDRQRMMQARDAFGAAWNSGNPEDVQRVMAQFPEYAAQIQKLIGVRDDQHRKDVGSMAVQLSGLLDSGNIQGAQDFIRQRKSMFDPSGMFSADSVANAIGAAAQADSVIDKDGNHSNKLGQWKDWASKLALSTLSPEEATNYGLNLQRLAEQEQRDLWGHQDRQAGNQLGWANYGERQRYHNEMFNRGTPGEREWAFFNGLSPEDQEKYLRMKRGPGVGSGAIQGMQTVKLSNGQEVQIDPKVHGSGDKAFYQGFDADGKVVNVPVSTVQTPISSQQQAGQTALDSDINTVLSASDEDLGHITGSLRGGGTGKMPFGADTYTGYKGGASRDVYNAANRIQGRMQNQGIADAKAAGASGINTVAEAKMYFQGMPQLDYSSPQALKSSLENIRDYTNEFNQSHGVKYSPTAQKPESKGGGEKSTSQMSDEELLGGL